MNMRKSLSVLLAVTLICGFLITAMVFVAGATWDVESVGLIGDSLWVDFTKGDIGRIGELIRAEFDRTSQLRSEMHGGMRYFDYGEPTADRVHAWYNDAVTDAGDEPATVGCMVQEFSGGFSTCLQAFGQPPQWACIIVTRESFDKGEAYTLRDAVASLFAQSGGLNSAWGLPTSNQYWVVEDGFEILYQQFENGYVRAVDGSSLSALCRFYSVDSEEYDPEFPKSGEVDRPSFGKVVYPP